MRLILLVSSVVLLASGCGASDEAKYAAVETQQGYAFAPPPAPPPPTSVAADSVGNMSRAFAPDQDGGGGGQPPQPGEPATARQMAYTYGYNFAVPTANMQGLLSTHEAACNNAGPAVCYVVNSSISGLGEDYAHGQLTLKASAEWVKSFQAGMPESLKGFGAELDASTSTAEDLTVQILDTSARLDSAKTLRDRLQQLLADRPGRLADLLEIERELARVQADIDSTESILAAMRLRVAMSTLTLSYTAKYSAVSQSVWRPLSDAFADFVPNIVASLAAIVAFISSVALWLVLTAAVVWLVLWRMRRRKKPAKPAPVQT